MPINIETPETKSKADIQIDLLREINDQLTTISKDQKHIGEFIGQSVHSIKVWIIVLGVLTLINAFSALFL